MNVAALPDLIFTVLFFFMVVTTMRTVEKKIAYSLPEGTELTPAGRQSPYLYIYARARGDADTTAAERNIQVNDRLCTAAEVGPEVERLRSTMNTDDAQRLTVIINADRATDMGTITDIKQALRRAGATRVVYAATRRANIDQP